MARRSARPSNPNHRRSSSWNGVHEGDAVVVDLPKERRNTFTFVAHVLVLATGEEWVEVRGGRAGEVKDRSFRPELLYPASARKGSRLTGQSLADAPQLPL
jgi:hypothetical protein